MLETMTDQQIQDHLKGSQLSTSENTTAYRRLAWDSWVNRCDVLAERLGVDSEEFGKYL